MTTAHKVWFAKAVLTLLAWACLGMVIYGISAYSAPLAWICAGVLGLAVTASLWRGIFTGLPKGDCRR